MLWNALWFKRNEPSKKHHLSLACRASKPLLASWLEVLGENRHSRPIRLVIHDPLRGDQLGSLRSARKKSRGRHRCSCVQKPRKSANPGILMQTIARSMADTGPMGGRYMPHAPPIVGRYGKRPHSRMRRLQLRTVHNLISSPRAFAARAAPKEPLVDSADVPAPRISGDQLGSLRSARKKSRGAPPLVAARLPVEPPQKNPLDKLGLPRSRSF